MTQQNTARDSQLNLRLTADLNMITSVDLISAGTITDPVFHFLYASQLYSSLFAVYGRFNITKGADSCRIDSIDMDLFNYSGAFNIGFTDENAVYRVEGTKEYILFGVRGMSTKRYQRISLHPDDTKLPEVIVPKDTPRHIIFTRFVYQMLGFTNNTGDIIEQTTGRLGRNIPETPYFDSEFYCRSGSDYYRNPLRTGQTEKSLKEINPEEFTKDIDLRVASPRCTQSDVKLIYR